MNIESSKAALMPAVHQAPAAPDARVSRAPAAQQVETQPSEPINHAALAAAENRKRIAIVEKAMGMNKSVIVEKDAHRVGFVYKTIDKTNGEVVRVFPQKEVSTALMALADSDARTMMQGLMVDALV